MHSSVNDLLQQYLEGECIITGGMLVMGDNEDPLTDRIFNLEMRVTKIDVSLAELKTEVRHIRYLLWKLVVPLITMILISVICGHIQILLF